MGEPTCVYAFRRGVANSRMFWPVTLIGIILLSGTAGFVWIESWPAWKALFFTLVTVTTVGYGDYGLSPSGERFAALLMIGGIGTVSYMVSQLVHEATVRATRPERKLMQLTKKLRGHYIVCGLGSMGLRVTRSLEASGVTVVAIDHDEAVVERLRERGMIALVGDATEDDVLHQVGIDCCAGVAAVTNSDAVNAMVCLTARALAPDISITARARDEHAVAKLKRAGADAVVSPCSYGGDGIAQTMLHPEVARLLYGQSDPGQALTFAQVKIMPESSVLGRTIEQIGHEHPRVVFMATKPCDGDIELRPSAGYRLRADDVLIVAGLGDDIGRLQCVRFAA